MNITTMEQSENNIMDDWKSITHVQSSMPKNGEQFSMFIGRWQPLHMGHQAMFNKVLWAGKNLLICIRDIQVEDENNPFSPQQVKENIENHYQKFIEQGIVKVMIIPDICSVEFGRGVGYDIIEHIPPPAIAEISATKIRKEMRDNGEL